MSADGRPIGWARRLANMLSKTSKVPCKITNLARDGASVADVLARQVEHVDAAADLVSVTVGMNDIRIARYSEQDFADGIATLLGKLASTGATVLTCTLPDIADVAPLPREHVEIARERLRQASDVIRVESAHTGAICLDIWAMGALTSNPMYFTEDRLHPNATGHRMLATAFAGLLPQLADLPGMPRAPRRVLLHGVVAAAMTGTWPRGWPELPGRPASTPRPADAGRRRWQLARSQAL